jgi:hypothetical protein
MFDKLKNARWSEALMEDPAWNGWMKMSIVSSPDYWRSQLANATNSPHVVALDPFEFAFGSVINSSLEIRAAVKNLTYESADGVAIGGGTTGGGTLGSSDAFSNATGMQVNMGGEANVSGGKVTGSGQLSQTATGTRTGTAGWSALSNRATNPADSVRFKFDTVFQITIRQDARISAAMSIATLGGANIGNAIAKIGDQTIAVQGSGTVRIPKARCTPLYPPSSPADITASPTVIGGPDDNSGGNVINANPVEIK